MAYVRICHKEHGIKFGVYGTKQHKVAHNSGVVLPLKVVGGRLT